MVRAARMDAPGLPHDRCRRPGTRLSWGDGLAQVKLHKALTLANDEYATQAGLVARGAIDHTFPRNE